MNTSLQLPGIELNGKDEEVIFNEMSSEEVFCVVTKNKDDNG